MEGGTGLAGDRAEVGFEPPSVATIGVAVTIERGKCLGRVVATHEESEPMTVEHACVHGHESVNSADVDAHASRMNDYGPERLGRFGHRRRCRHRQSDVANRDCRVLSTGVRREARPSCLARMGSVSWVATVVTVDRRGVTCASDGVGDCRVPGVTRCASGAAPGRLRYGRPLPGSVVGWVAWSGAGRFSQA